MDSSIITKNTPIYSNIKKISIDEININETANILKRWNNWTKIDNKLYYFKPFNFNELIGEYLCNFNELECVHNEIGLNEASNKLYLLTKNFRDDNKYSYEYASYIPLENLKSKCKNAINYRELINNLLKLFSIDIFMMQNDREPTINMMFKKDQNGWYSFAPAYDFSDSFSSPHYYSTPYFYIELKNEPLYQLLFSLTFYHTKYTIEEFINLYPSFYKLLKNYLDISLSDILSQIEKDYSLNIPAKRFEQYNNYEQKSKKILKRIL